MMPIPNRSQLLRFPEGTLLNHKYLLVSPPEAAAGRPKSHYVVPLGRGGSSIVFLARQVLFEQHAHVGAIPYTVLRAIKFYQLSPALVKGHSLYEAERANTQNVVNEIKNLTCVDHDNILKVIDAGTCECGGLAVNYLVTDYVPGPTLRDVIACRRSRYRQPAGELVYRWLRADPTQIVRILNQVCAAVEYLHEQSLYHCDIAPKNIFLHLGAGCRPVLGDFTLGRQLADWNECVGREIGGAMSYAPNRVHCNFGCTDGPRDFAGYAAYWDLYGFAKSALELVSLAPAGLYLPWKNDLIRCLGEALHEENGTTAAALHQRIAKLL
jgi:serine/threonine protein kinase